MNPRVSIIIPVYNAETWVAATINNALQQSYVNKEIIVVDDGSTDNSFKIAKQFERDGVIVISQTNGGAAVARNMGLVLANGDFVQFLDAGDLLSPDKIEKEIEVLKYHPNKLAVCNYIKFYSENELANPHCPNQASFIFSTNKPLDFLVNLWGGNGPSNFIQTNCWLVPRHLIGKVNGWRAYRCPDDDGEFFTRLILASEGIVYVPGVYNFYRVGSGANKLSGSRNRKHLMNTLLTLDLKYRYLLQHGSHLQLNRAMAKQYLNFAVYNFPSQAVLSAVAIKRYKQLGVTVRPPLLGGKLVEGMKAVFGWRTVRFLQFYLREKCK